MPNHSQTHPCPRLKSKDQQPQNGHHSKKVFFNDKEMSGADIQTLFEKPFGEIVEKMPTIKVNVGRSGVKIFYYEAPEPLALVRKKFPEVHRRAA